jgi:hypothetical protein
MFSVSASPSWSAFFILISLPLPRNRRGSAPLAEIRLNHCGFTVRVMSWSSKEKPVPANASLRTSISVDSKAAVPPPAVRLARSFFASGSLLTT